MRQAIVFLVLVLVAVLAHRHHGHGRRHGFPHGRPQHHQQDAELAVHKKSVQPQNTKIIDAIAVLQPTANNKAYGTIYFKQVAQGVAVSGIVRGLEPNSVHAIHVHQYGDISSPDGTATGLHFNPYNVEHGMICEQLIICRLPLWKASLW